MWQDIETAPQDGTPILVFCPDQDGDQIVVAEWESGSWQLSQTGSYAEDGDLYEKPSHWMPLPARPAEYAYRKCNYGYNWGNRRHDAHVIDRANYLRTGRVPRLDPVGKNPFEQTRPVDAYEPKSEAEWEQYFETLKEAARQQQAQSVPLTYLK